MKKLTELNPWQALSSHHNALSSQHMRDWFAKDAERFTHFHLQLDELLLDYSRNRIDTQTIALLCDLANAVGLADKIEALFTGKPLNLTESRPALHTALRDTHVHPIWVNGENITPMLAQTRQRLNDFVTAIHQQTWKGSTGKPIRHVVNIGIGGSHLGPMMCTQTLKNFAVTDLQIHFISSIDEYQVNEVLNRIDPETTLFIISSKSFSTIETLTNAKSIITWMRERLGPDVIKHHFIAVTAAAPKAEALGIPSQHIFPMWEWVGGRYSIWSAVGLPLMLQIGNDHFADFLRGAHEMDLHFRHAPFDKNMPVILAMISIWYMNFFGAHAQAIVPYLYRLRHLVSYLQQAEMESNGKNVNLQGDAIHYATSPVIFGEEGCNGQHTYHQLLHQGNHFIPVDFILTGDGSSDHGNIHHDLLIASCLSQANALMRGKTYPEAVAELIAANISPEHAKQLAHHQTIAGNKPSNLILMKRMTPKNLGALLALYEHKIFVQGVIWDINSFDQWGVELGKQLLPDILLTIQHKHLTKTMDASTMAAIDFLYTKNEPST